ncbi:MAG: nicotinate-nucleotide adenylyltransferase [Lachnospiraceae bacterium]|nr:nicotinate-nucleotide adenylyltransferase [Lachnospiraceae bacterium]
MKKIGILGGTFNPIHFGHLIIAEQALSEFKLDQVLIMPSGNSYLKKDMKMPEAEVRLLMARLAVSDNPSFSVSDMEIRRGGNTYTADTIEELNSLYPDDALFFITGADALHEMKKWVTPERIFSGCTVITSVRNNEGLSELNKDIDFYKEHYDAKIELLHTTNIDISSSMIRELIKNGRSVRYYVPEAVRRFIYEQHLYEQ